MDYKCAICDNTRDNISYVGKEMMLGLRDKFDYFKCSQCGCLQIVEIPSNLDKYYPSNYYSYNLVEYKSKKHRIATYLLSHSLNYRLNNFDIIGWLAIKYNNYYLKSLPWIKNKYLDFDSKILDIGCGNGQLLIDLYHLGFKKLSGIDPFISKDIEYYNTVKIIKEDVYEINDKFDFIMMHHSFEHMPNPLTVFEKLAKILDDNGTILIRIPIVDCQAWRKYGMSWFQIDAPRHFFLHTITSINNLARKFNLRIDNIVFDSSEAQFVISEKYLRDISLDISCDNLFTDIDILHFKDEADKLNRIKDGDQACFFIKREDKS